MTGPGTAPSAGSAPPPRDAADWRLWFGLLGGAIAWTAHLLLAWAVAEFGCVGGFLQWTFLGVTGLAWLIIVISVATFAFAVAATVVGWRAGSDPRFAHGSVTEARGSATDLARTAVYTSGLFAMIIAVEALPILFFLEGC